MSFGIEFTSFPGPGGPVQYGEIPWDTELFGISFYEIRCDGTADEVRQALPGLLGQLRSRESNAALAFTRIRPEDLRLAEGLSHLGFYPAETTLHISMPLRRFSRMHTRSAGRGQLRRARERDLPAVLSIARQTFFTDRFHIDPHLSNELCDERYARWVERGFHDGDPLFVFEATQGASADEIMGFYLIRGIAGGDVNLSLAGVHPRLRGAGVGALMYEDMLETCREMGFRSASTSVSTNNPDVVNLFMRLGFVIRSTQLTMHLYLDGAKSGAGPEA